LASAKNPALSLIEPVAAAVGTPGARGTGFAVPKLFVFSNRYLATPSGAFWLSCLGAEMPQAATAEPSGAPRLRLLPTSANVLNALFTIVMKRIITPLRQFCRHEEVGPSCLFRIAVAVQRRGDRGGDAAALGRTSVVENVERQASPG
jgi:hypothetical protein